MKKLLKTLSRLDSILLAVTIISTSAAGYGAYTSYDSARQVQKLSAKVSSLESASSDSLVLIETYKNDADKVKSEIRVLENMNLAAEKKISAQAQTISDLKSSKTTYSWNLPQKPIEKLEGSNSRILSKEEALATLDNLFNSSSSTAPSSTSTPVYYAQAATNSKIPSVDNSARISEIKSELADVNAELESARTSYYPMLANLQALYNSYHDQAQQAYIEVQKLKQSSNGTETEKSRIQSAQERQAQIAAKAGEAKDTMDDFTATYNKTVDDLEDYRDELIEELNSLY